MSSEPSVEVEGSYTPSEKPAVRLEVRVQGLGFRVVALGFRDLGFRVQGLGFRIFGFGV